MKQITLKDKMQQLVNTLSARIIDADNDNGYICYREIMNICNECNNVIDEIDAILEGIMINVD